MQHITIISAVIISVLAIIYILLAKAINMKAIVNIDGIVYVFKKRPSLLPTLIGLAIIAAVIITVLFTCSDCLTYRR